MAQIGDILTELREENGLKQDDLAKILHLSISSISAYELGKRPPTVFTLIEYAKYFGVSTDYILGLTQYEGSLSVFSEEIVPGKTIGDVISLLRKLRPEQLEALLIVLRDMSFYTEIANKTETAKDRQK